MSLLLLPLLCHLALARYWAPPTLRNLEFVIQEQRRHSASPALAAILPQSLTPPQLQLQQYVAPPLWTEGVVRERCTDEHSALHRSLNAHLHWLVKNDRLTRAQLREPDPATRRLCDTLMQIECWFMAPCPEDARTHACSPFTPDCHAPCRLYAAGDTEGPIMFLYSTIARSRDFLKLDK